MIFAMLAQAVFLCGYQPPNAVMCIDDYGRLKTPSVEDRRAAFRHRKQPKQSLPCLRRGMR
jgi:hypothetical protein